MKIRTEKSSPVHVAFSEGSHEPSLPELPYLAECMWRQIPESRPLLRRRQAAAEEEAIEYGQRVISDTPGLVAADILWHPLIQPALKGYPETHDRLAQYLHFVLDMYERKKAVQVADGTSEALHFYVLEPLSQYKPIVQELVPGLLAVMRRDIPYIK